MKKKLGDFLYFIYLFTYSGKHKWGRFRIESAVFTHTFIVSYSLRLMPTQIILLWLEYLDQPA